jgi:hypothetical protein
MQDMVRRGERFVVGGSFDERPFSATRPVYGCAVRRIPNLGFVERLRCQIRSSHFKSQAREAARPLKGRFDDMPLYLVPNARSPMITSGFPG